MNPHQRFFIPSTLIDRNYYSILSNDIMSVSTNSHSVTYYTFNTTLVRLRIVPKTDMRQAI